MDIQLFTDQKYLNRKQALLACFLFVFTAGLCSQSLADKVIGFYAPKQNLCYGFEEKRYSKAFPVSPLVSRGIMMCYKEEHEVYYKGIHTYDLALFKDTKFETVKNRHYFGTNYFKEGFFKDYAELPEKKQFYAYRNAPGDILRPDSSLKSVFGNTVFVVSEQSSGDVYVLRFTDTSQVSFTNADGKRSKVERVFYISKTNYSIVKSSVHTWWNIAEYDKSDSVVYLYNYFELPFKQVKDSVDGFVPLRSKPLADKPLKDTTTYFPEFHLPDQSGKIKEIQSEFVLIDFWYKGCIPCIVNMKFLDSIHYKNVQVVTINISDSVDKEVQKIISNHKLTYLFGGQELVKQLRVQAFPTMYLIDRKRKILYKHIGLGNTGELKTLLQKISSE